MEKNFFWTVSKALKVEDKFFQRGFVVCNTFSLVTKFRQVFGLHKVAGVSLTFSDELKISRGVIKKKTDKGKQIFYYIYK